MVSRRGLRGRDLALDRRRPGPRSPDLRQFRADAPGSRADHLLLHLPLHPGPTAHLRARQADRRDHDRPERLLRRDGAVLALPSEAVLRRIAKIVGAGAVALVVAAALAFVGWAWNESRIPGTYNAMDYGRLDFGGGPHVHAMGAMPSMPSTAGHRMSVAALRGPRGKPDVRFHLVAMKGDVRLASGRVVHGLTFNGRSPGPELRARRGDLVEVVLENADVEGGVTIHWHGVDVPNAEDGVAGVTQDAVRPGQRYTYRFRPPRAGTYWYHSHQSSAEEVGRGLFGAFVVEPRRPLPHGTLDLALVAHEFDGVLTLGSSDRLPRRAVAPGTPVRLRLVNSVGRPMSFTLDGTPFRVLAIDGTDLSGPTPLVGTALEVAGG